MCQDRGFGTTSANTLPVEAVPSPLSLCVKAEGSVQLQSVYSWSKLYRAHCLYVLKHGSVQLRSGMWEDLSPAELFLSVLPIMCVSVLMSASIVKSIPTMKSVSMVMSASC